jgi:hypothetical protein
MKGGKRREARYQRRKAAREAKRKAKLGVFDDFERVADFDSLHRAALGSMRGVAWRGVEGVRPEVRGERAAERRGNAPETSCRGKRAKRLCGIYAAGARQEDRKSVV